MCTDVLAACVIPESTARSVMEHALLNDEREYRTVRRNVLDDVDEPPHSVMSCPHPAAVCDTTALSYAPIFMCS